MIYLNNAADSYPKPLAIKKVVDGLPYMEIDRICNCNKETDMTNLLRSKLSSFLNLPDTYQVTLTNSATEAANLVIKSFHYNRKVRNCVGYDLKSHNCVIRPLIELYGDIASICYDINNDIETEGFVFLNEHELKDMQFFTFPLMTNVSGEVNNVTEVIRELKILKSNLPLIIDISQAIGNMEIDVSSWDYENLYLFGTFHKSMMSIPGCGFLIHPKENELVPLIYGGTGTETEDMKQPKEFPFYLESGTKNMLAISCAVKSLDMIDGMVSEHVKVKKELVEYFISRYQMMEDDLSKEYFMLPEYNVHPESGIINLLAKDAAIGESITIDLANKYKIITRFGTHCSPRFSYYSRKWNQMIKGTIRISFSNLNTQLDVRNFLKCFHNCLLELEVKLRRN